MKSELTRDSLSLRGLLDGCDGRAGDEDDAEREKLSNENQEGDITQFRSPLRSGTDAVDGFHKLFGELQAHLILIVQAAVDAHN